MTRGLIAHAVRAHKSNTSLWLKKSALFGRCVKKSAKNHVRRKFVLAKRGVIVYKYSVHLNFYHEKHVLVHTDNGCLLCHDSLRYRCYSR